VGVASGPPVRTGTPLHRAEHALLALALVAALVYLVASLGATTWWRVAFWALAPDLVFVPIALGARGGAWPRWGAALYDATHTYLVMLPAFALASFAQCHVVWPLLAWAAHIETDRALGFDLRWTR
jgi:hypothetical protein